MVGQDPHAIYIQGSGKDVCKRGVIHICAEAVRQGAPYDCGLQNRRSVPWGINLNRRLLHTHIFAKELLAEFLQCAVGAQFFHRRADFGERLVIALVGDKAGADFLSASARQATRKPESGFFFI